MKKYILCVLGDYCTTRIYDNRQDAENDRKLYGGIIQEYDDESEKTGANKV